VYALAGAAFVFATEPLFRLLNTLGHLLLPGSPALALPSERFWLVLTTSLMVTLVYLSWKAGSDIRRNQSALFAILLSKATSTVVFLLVYLSSDHAFAYLAGAGIDGAIFLIHMVLYRRLVTF